MVNLRSNLAVYLLLALTPLGGWSAANADEPVSFRFRTLGWESAGIPELFFRSGDGKNQVIEVPQIFRSPEYNYSGSPEIVFYQTQSAEGGSEAPVPVCSYRVDPSVKDWLFLFVRDESTGTIRVFGMDDSTASFPFGGTRYFNLTDRTLGIIYGAKKFRMEPRSYETALPGVAPAGNVQLQILAVRNEKLQDIYNTQWPQESNVRYLIFIIESESRRDRVEVKPIAEYQRGE